VSDQSPERGSGGGAARARLTPYELVFTERFESEVFPKIVAEANRHGVDLLQPDRFQLLAAVGDAVRDVVPPEAPPDALEQYRALLYHAFHFWSFEKRLYLLEPPTARYLVEAAPGLEGWELTVPQPSFYLQLPANLFWGSVSPEATPEPVDGFFVTSTTAEDALGLPFRRVAVLVVLGIRRHRAGFSVIPFDTEVGPGIAAEWALPGGRETRADFQTVLPGGEIGGLYSILTTSEVLKLVARTLWYIDRFPEDLQLEEPIAGEERPGEMPLPRLPYHRIGLGRGGAEAG
jgi:hypothetical protein